MGNYRILKIFYDKKRMNTEIYRIERYSYDQWVSVGSSTAYNSLSYTVQVPTSQDSTNEDNGINYFRIIASMEEGLWISDVDSGYSVNNNYLETMVVSNLSSRYSLLQNYPNPFNMKTIIDYSLIEKGHVNVSIYDMEGRIVKTIINNIQ